MKPRELTREDVLLEFKVEPEDCPVLGSEMAEGCEAAILERLRNGDIYAWCRVTVTVKWRSFTGSQSLGCCQLSDNYNLGDIVDDHNLIQYAIGDLNERVQNAYAVLELLL